MHDAIRRFVRHHDLVRVLTSGFIFGLAVLLVQALGLENQAFLYSMILACVGFPIHHVLPRLLKLPFFVLLSFASIVVAVGVGNAVWIISLGTTFIVLAHLPIPFWLRVGAQGVLGAALIVFRADLIPSAIPAAIWPILGSMFIFRLMIYMYDLKAKSTEFGPWKALAYFFMVPNVNFTLLPVIDYKNLFAVYYPKNKSAHEIYQKGATLLIKGIIHLLLYRFIYQNVIVDPATITDASAAGQYLVGTFLLYLRISGYFHMFSGILHMYGFNLPETHHLYFLASSYTDFWRRINIFWKDFMQKMFFYPVHFRLSKVAGPLTTVSLATLYAFLVTFFLHSYQWFWIRGEFKFSAQDALFWGSLGVVVWINLIWEMKFPKKRSLKGPIRTWKSELILAIKTILTFTSIVFIWNIWSTPDFAEFNDILSNFANFGFRDFINFSVFFIFLGSMAILYGHKTRGDSSLLSFGNKLRTQKNNPNHDFWSAMTKTGALALLLLFFSHSPASFPGSPGAVSTVMRLTSGKLNERDSRLLQRGYYEDLTNVARFNPELQALYSNMPADWTANKAFLDIEGAFPFRTFLPSISTRFMHADFSTNQWGFRDKEYTKQKPPGTYRIAIVGASHTLGNGVNDDENYETLFEDRVNQVLAGSNAGAFEMLNLAIGGLGPAAKIKLLEELGLQMDIDGMMYVAINDFVWLPREIAKVYYKRIDAFPYSQVREIVEGLGLEYGMARTEGEIRLREHMPEILRWYYTYLRDMAKQNELELWITIIPMPVSRDEKSMRSAVALQKQIAEELGIKVIDITDTYASVKDLSSLWVAPWDDHPRPEGHQMLADRLYESFSPQLFEAMKQ